MKTQFKRPLLAVATAAALTALAASPAHAIRFVGVAAEGPLVVEDYSVDGLMSFDIDFGAVTTATLSYMVEAGDLGGMGLSFNAVLRNFAGMGLGGYDFGLSTGAFEEVGTVTRQFGGSSTLAFSGANATVRFASPEFLDVEIGDPLSVGAGKVDWAIDGLAAGDRLSITVSAVPEPGTYALLLSGIGLVGWLARRRRSA